MRIGSHATRLDVAPDVQRLDITLAGIYMVIDLDGFKMLVGTQVVEVIRTVLRRRSIVFVRWFRQ